MIDKERLDRLILEAEKYSNIIDNTGIRTFPMILTTELIINHINSFSKYLKNEYTRLNIDCSSSEYIIIESFESMLNEISNFENTLIKYGEVK